jgi:hypothetical protein
MPGTASLPSANFIKSSQRLVRPKTGKFLFKSQSTPHLRGRHMMSDSELAKRNKLGYQRISIACGMSLLSVHTTLPHRCFLSI